MALQPSGLPTVDFGLYLHVPFCTKRCPYCAFVLIEGEADDRYASAVERHMDAEVAARGRVSYSSLYFGGGTPSLLAPSGVARLVAAARGRFAARDPLEVTLEANPDGVDEARLRALRQAGVNRLSIGVQDLDDRVLRFLGRTHDAAGARRAFESARAAGFDNVVVDIIFGCPGQDFERTLAEVLAWAPEHVSLYGLTVERGTDLDRSVKRGAVLPDEESQRREYELAMDRLGAAGYRHYELSNWARPGFESRHNSGCWAGRPYLGFGPGAHSYVPPRRWVNASNVERYLAGDATPMSEEHLTPGQRMLEAVFLALRREEGLDVAAFEREFAVAFRERYARTLEVAGDGLEWTGGRLRLTRRGRLVADAIIAGFA